MAEQGEYDLKVFFFLFTLYPDLVDSLDGILTTLLDDKIQVWTMRSLWRNAQVHTLLDKLDAASDQPLPAELRACTSLKTPTLYIFTSGTTGECVLVCVFVCVWCV